VSRVGRPLIIAIDGPGAAGKGTLARRVAAHLDLPHLDTGLLYRAVARRLLDAGARPDDAAAAIAAATSLRAEDLERDDLRGPPVDAAASTVSAIADVRAALLAFQRAFPGARGAVLDGRDIGTVIFPAASAKLFVTASVAARGQRRWRELRARGIEADLTTVTNDLRARDAADAARATAPLVPAADALMLDTTALDADAAFAEAVALLAWRLGSES
jgi:cytidylate kinase